jgi:hypothetical protein
VDTSGNLQYGYGADTGTFTFDDLATSTGITLQTAYVAGNTITTSAAEGSVVIAGDQTLQVTATNGLDVDTIADFDVTTFDVQMTGTNGFSIDGTDASNITTSSGNLTLSASSNRVIIEGGEAIASAVTISATNAAGGVDINAGSGGVDIDSTNSISIDAAAASNFTTSSGTLTLDGSAGVIIEGNANPVDINSGFGTWDASILQLTSTGLMDLSSGANIDIDAVTSITIDSGNGLSLGAGSASDFTTSSGIITVDGADGINIQGNASEIDITTTGVLDINSGSGTWNASTLDLTATSTVDVTGTVVAIDSTAGAITMDAVGGGISLDGAAASNFTTTTGALTLDGNGGVNIAGNASEVDITTTGTIDINGGTVTVDSTGSISIDAAAASNFTTSVGAVTINGAGGINIEGNASEIDLTTTGAVDINAATVEIDSSSTFSIDGVGASNVTVDSGSLTLSTTTAGAVILSSSDNIDIDAVNGVTIDGSGASSFTIDSGDLTISTTTSGTVVVQGIDPVEINRVGGLNTEIVKLTQTTGSNFGIFAGSAAPTFSADAGDLFIRVDGSSSEMYQNTSSPSPGNTWTQFALGTSVSDLQTAYEGGNTITTSAAEGSVVISGDQTLQITTSGGLDVDTVADFDVTTFDVQMTGTNGFSIDGTDASNVTTSSGDLTLSAAANSVVIDGGEAAADAVTITASNAAGGIDINAGTGGITIDAAAASSFTTSAGALTLDGAGGITIEGNAGAVDVNSGVGTWDASSLALTTTGLLDLNAGANMDVDVTGTFDLLSTGTFSIDGTGSSNITATSGDLLVSTDVAGAVVVTSAANVDINAATSITVDAATGISIDAGAASNFTTSVGAITIDGGDGLNLQGNASEIDITTSGPIDINSGAATWDATTLSLDATDDTNLTMTANDGAAHTLTIAASNAGAGTASINISADEDFTVDSSILSLDATDNTNLSMAANDGGTKILRIDASNSGAGTALIDINADEDITIDSTAGAVSIDSSAASNFTTSSGDLTLSATANSVIVDGAEAAADAVRINASNLAGGIDIDAGTAGIDISTTGALSADATGQITIGGTNASAVEVQVAGAANSEIITLTQTTGESFGVFAGTTDPSGSVTADAGSLFVRDTGSGAELYQNTSTGSGTTWAQFTSGSTSVPTGNTIWVDSVNGNDSTGAADDLGRPFLTIAAAIAASSTGDTIQLLPGNYPEDGLDLTGLSLIGLGGWEHTVVGPAPASATDDVIILGDGGYVEGISLNIPATSGTPSSSVPAPPGGTRGFVAILCNQATGTNSIYNIAMYGNGVTPLSSAGSGIYRSGGGKTIGQNIRVEGGGIVDCMKVDQGVLALEGIHVPQSTGAITNVLYVTGRGGPPITAAGRAQMVGFNSGNSNVTNAIRIDSGVSVSIRPTAIVFTPNIFNANTALSSGGDYISVALLGGRLENVTTAVSVDLTANGDDAVYRINSNHQPDYIYNPQVAANSDFSLTFTQEATDELESSFNIFGSEQLSVGFVERGVASAFGRGRPFISGMTVITSDSTASSVSDGGNLTDVTAAARSKVGSLVSFQGTAANHTILWGSQRKDAANNPLKFWGVEAVVDTAGGLGGSYVFEIWDGTNWVEVTSQATSFVEGYSYGKTFFERSSSDEIFRFGLDRTETFRPSSTNPFGVDRSSTWTAKTISGINAYWVRARIVTAPATSPQFESFKLIESTFNVSADGVPSQTGLSKLRSNVPLAGRVWSGAIAGMGSTLSNGTVTMGNTAGVTFVQQFNESEATSAGNTYSVQFSVPLGICTAFPIKVSVAARIDTGGAVSTPVTAPIALGVSALPQRLSGVLVADPAGGLTPVKRDYADADLLSAAGSRDPYDDVFNIEPEGAVAAGATWADLENQVHLIDLAEIDVENLYSEDIVIFQFGIDTLGPLTSFIPFALVLEGVTYQSGKSLS